ncbi:unnamed protein product, partial [Protopolystoma xenopodis]
MALVIKRLTQPSSEPYISEISMELRMARLERLAILLSRIRAFLSPSQQ